MYWYIMCTILQTIIRGGGGAGCTVNIASALVELTHLNATPRPAGCD